MSSESSLENNLSSVINLFVAKVKHLAFQANAAAAMFSRGFMRYHRPLMSDPYVPFLGVLYAHSPLCQKDKPAMTVVKPDRPQSSAQSSE